MKIIESPEEIKDAEYKFRDILFDRADEIIDRVHWSNDLGIGYKYTENDDYNRYFNGFGIVRPDVNIEMSVFCEINIEKDGLNKNTAGAFAKDIQGNLYVIHRGNIAGINRTEFFNKYAGKTAQIQDGNTKTEAIIIGNLDDPKLPEDIKTFVFEVAQIKGLLNNKLKEFLEKIFKNYQSAKKEKFLGNSLVRLIQEDFPKYLENIIPNSNDFIFKGNAGKGNYTECPSVAILNKEITKGVGSGYFVIYIFSKDTKHLYLSLNQAILGEPEKDLKNRLISKADKFRKKLGEHSR